MTIGRQATKRECFVSISLEEYVPQDHLLRVVDRFLDPSEFRQSLAGSYSHTGRPSIDPELMIRMLIIGYCYGIRSERRLCEEVNLNLAYRWFCRLGLTGKVPDHSTFSKNRHGRFRDNDTFRQLFETVLRRCMAEGLVRGEGFVVDASVVRADANRARGVPDDGTIDWGNADKQSRAVREYLAGLEESAPKYSESPTPTNAETLPKRISLTDPAARYTAAPGGPAFFGYSTNYLIDLHAGIIVDVEATPAHRTAEVDSAKTMVDRVEESFHLKPHRLVGDTAYGTAPSWLGWWKKKPLSHTCQYGIERNARMAHFRIAPFNGTQRKTNIGAPQARPFAVSGGLSRTSAVTSPRTTRLNIVPVSLIARAVA
jgi:transposase